MKNPQQTPVQNKQPGVKKLKGAASRPSEHRSQYARGRHRHSGRKH